MQAASPALATQRSQPLPSPAGYATPGGQPQLFQTHSVGAAGAAGMAAGWGVAASPAAGTPWHTPAPGAAWTPAAGAAAAADVAHSLHEPWLPPGIGSTPGMVHAQPPPRPPPLARPEDGPPRLLARLASPPRPPDDDLPPGFVSGCPHFLPSCAAA